MGILKSPGKLDGYIQDALKGFLMTSLIQLSIVNPFLQTAAFHIFGKDSGDTAQCAHIVTAYCMRMKAEVDPGLTLLRKVLFLFFGLEVILPGVLYSQFNVPAAVMNLIDLAKTAFTE